MYTHVCSSEPRQYADSVCTGVVSLGVTRPVRILAARSMVCLAGRSHIVIGFMFNQGFNQWFLFHREGGEEAFGPDGLCTIQVRIWARTYTPRSINC